MGHDQDHKLDCTTSHLACTDCTDFDATSGGHGLMPKADKIKLDAIEAGAEVGNCSIVVGTYTGDGAVAQEIDTGVNGQIQHVSIISRLTAEAEVHKFEKWNENWGDYALIHWSAGNIHNSVDNRINSLSVDGKFTVDDDGANNHPNSNGVVYSYVALIG